MTRLLLADDPGAAHPTKNATAPGLPNQTRTPSKGRTPMLRNRTPHATTDEVVYTPEALNALIEQVSAARVAERLRERALAHWERAKLWEHATGDVADPQVVFHAGEAEVLELMAAMELQRADLDAGRSV
ncbi:MULTISPECIES: hypothetical protein [Prauserella salsuginis group]|uniref:Antitoxin VbhA domain-containing protein n=1 Tax=Prauserella salsuginis TaxID=387889 RepID=A0ABW6G273_9PSEU|nr:MULTISPECIES: hypothetical protein [Prauserella salsuginis group]MCR3719922.1 hypothetical protein [Prauserella flava]MCR3736534.1 hypothetical protein [Prauserella salsuginis]